MSPRSGRLKTDLESLIHPFYELVGESDPRPSTEVLGYSRGVRFADDATTSWLEALRSADESASALF